MEGSRASACVCLSGEACLWLSPRASGWCGETAGGVLLFGRCEVFGTMTMEPAAAVTRLGMITINNYMLLFTVTIPQEEGEQGRRRTMRWAGYITHTAVARLTVL